MEGANSDKVFLGGRGCLGLRYDPLRAARMAECSMYPELDIPNVPKKCGQHLLFTLISRTEHLVIIIICYFMSDLQL
jgi:hypothetical protein